ncbi:MAG: lipopolysaccharide heptosyltransferase II [Calditrichaceae bacterium]
MKPNKILIIQTAYLGDVILITPLIRAVKELFPEAVIDAMVIPQTKGVLDNNPYLRNVITFDKRNNKLTAFWRTVKHIRKNEYDLAISPHSSITTAYLMKLGGIEDRLGFDRWQAAKHLTKKVPHLNNIHKIKRILHLLTVFTDREFDMQSELFPDEAMKKAAGKIFSDLPFPGRPVIAIAPGSVWFTKRWPEEYYSRLAGMLHNEKFNLIFIGAGNEYELNEKIIKDSKSAAVNLTGKTNILESAAIIESCDLMICNDSGPLHIANAMQTDVFAFFGPTVRSIGYFPFRENDIVFEIDLDCRPCSSHGGSACPLKHHNCMKQITPELVLSRVRQKFGDV